MLEYNSKILNGGISMWNKSIGGQVLLLLFLFFLTGCGIGGLQITTTEQLEISRYEGSVLSVAQGNPSITGKIPIILELETKEKETIFLHLWDTEKLVFKKGVNVVIGRDQYNNIQYYKEE